MKHKMSFLTLIVMCFFIQSTVAQLPQVSTSDNPAWYYIQVMGEGSAREDRVFVAQGNALYGEALNTSKDAQLFRFEKEGNNYIIISKSTNKKVNVGINDGEEALLLSEEGLEFSIDPLSKHYFNITATKAVTGGSSDKIWAHQANSGSSYKIILVSTTYKNSENSHYSFIYHEEMKLQYSTQDLSVWYYIKSAKEEFSNMLLTDVSATEESEIPLLLLEELEDNNDSQLWKLERKSNSILITNKSTGNRIETRSSLIDDSDALLKFNFTQAGKNTEINTAWELRHIRSGQYVISGIEDDGIVRYLNASDLAENPDMYNPEDLISSGFAWKLSFVSTTVETGVTPPTSIEDSNYRIYSVDKKIVVEGTEDYSIRTIHGVIVSKQSQLQTGIYIISIDGKPTKLLVN